MNRRGFFKLLGLAACALPIGSSPVGSVSLNGQTIREGTLVENPEFYFQEVCVVGDPPSRVWIFDCAGWPSEPDSIRGPVFASRK